MAADKQTNRGANSKKTQTDGPDKCFINICPINNKYCRKVKNDNTCVAWNYKIHKPYLFQFARERGIESPGNNKYLSLKSMSGSDDGLDRSEMTEISRTLDSRPSGQRSNSSVHVCWHR